MIGKLYDWAKEPLYDMAGISLVNTYNQFGAGIHHFAGGDVTGFDPLGNPRITPIHRGWDGGWSANLGRAANTTLSVGLNAVGIIGGFSEGGISGGLYETYRTVAEEGAMARYGYSTAMINGQSKTVMGSLGGKGWYQKWRSAGGLKKAAAMTAGFGSFMGRNMGSLAATSFVSSAIGGPIGLALTPAAATFGAANAGTMAVAAGVVGGGYLLGKGAYTVLQWGNDYRQSQRMINTSGSMMAFSTQSASTMRSRAIQAIQKSKINGRSALGQEAALLANPSRSYFSPYRAGY